MGIASCRHCPQPRSGINKCEHTHTHTHKYIYIYMCVFLCFSLWWLRIWSTIQYDSILLLSLLFSILPANLLLLQAMGEQATKHSQEIKRISAHGAAAEAEMRKHILQADAQRQLFEAEIDRESYKNLRLRIKFRRKKEGRKEGRNQANKQIRNKGAGKRTVATFSRKKCPQLTLFGLAGRSREIEQLSNKVSMLQLDNTTLREEVCVYVCMYVCVCVCVCERLYMYVFA